MDYQSNLIAPDLRKHFRHTHERVMSHSQGHNVLSDFADRPENDSMFGLYKNCGFLTRDEAAILYHCVLATNSLNGAETGDGWWLDVGCHTGWTTAHIAEAVSDVVAVDPMLAVPAFAERFRENLDHLLDPESVYSLPPLMERPCVASYPVTSDQFFADITLRCLLRQKRPPEYTGAMIDGDHNRPCPLNDAVNCAESLASSGVLLFHDFIGAPVQEAVLYLMDNGFRCRVYNTPHMMAACFRGQFVPPHHLHDPAIDWFAVHHSMKPFPFGRCV